jgi:hypothetical protein
MIPVGAGKTTNTLTRIGVWFVCLLVSVTAFSLFFRTGAFFVFRATMTFALPVWFLYLPFVIVLKDAEQRRGWIIVASGIAIGPASLALWGLILQLRGGDKHTIWQGDGIGLGVLQGMICAAIVGFLMTACYAIALKVICRRSSALKAP